MKIIFLGGLFPNEIRNEIQNKSIGMIQYAADALQWGLVEGLGCHTEELKIVNLPYIGSYPIHYKDSMIKSFNFSHRPGANDFNVGFLNLPLYNLYSKYYNAKRIIKNFLNNNSEIILVYAIHTPFIKAAVDLKNKNPSLKICLVVPDLPQFMGGSDNFILKFLKRKEQKLLNSLLEEVDSFVLLSDYMHKPLNIGDKPWIRVEGIFSPKENIDFVEKENFKTIMYSGALAKKYGVLILIEAFAMIEDENYRLWICGDGDSKDEVFKMAKKDSRIKYFGQLPREEVLVLQRKATVLVNPRTTEGEYTRFSFPSKTMEYFASGTPCIMNNLLGVPKEYFDFCFIPINETAIGLYQTIILVCKKNQKELSEFGNNAKNFILENKTPNKQCEKIYNMLTKL